MAKQQADQSGHGVESGAQAVDPLFGIEIHGLVPIPTEHRHGEPKELFWTWLGGNFNYVVLAAGAFTIIFGLNIWQAISAAGIGSILGAIVFGLCGIFGPRTATATIVNTRAAFGLNGYFPAVLISWLSASGWVAVNSVLAVFACPRHSILFCSQEAGTENSASKRHCAGSKIINRRVVRIHVGS